MDLLSATTTTTRPIAARFMTDIETRIVLMSREMYRRFVVTAPTLRLHVEGSRRGASALTSRLVTQSIEASTSERARGRQTLALAVLAGTFALCVSVNPNLNSAITVGLTAATLVGCILLARRIEPTRSGALVGAVVAVVSLWLLAQRDDTGSALILAALFGVAVALVIRAAGRLPGSLWLGYGLVALAARLLGAERAVLVIAAIGVLATALTALNERHTAHRPRRTSALLAVLSSITIVFTCYIGAETPEATWFGGGIIHGPTNNNDIALTFDDGPDVTSTPEVMAILDRYGVKGTFFEVGKAVVADPQITRALYADGQLIGNHSYHHDQWRWLDPRYPELQRDQKAIKQAIGVCPAMYRPPHGERTPFLARVVHDHHMHIVLWNASAGDWATNNPQLVAERILRGAKPGGILLLHDGLDGNPTANRQVLVAALPLILDGLRARHLTPVRLDQLLGVPAYAPC